MRWNKSNCVAASLLVLFVGFAASVSTNFVQRTLVRGSGYAPESVFQTSLAKARVDLPAALQRLPQALGLVQGWQWILASASIILLSAIIGVVQYRKVLRLLKEEERWRTVGYIAAGITHDLGNRLAVLQQTAALADTEREEYLPIIRENLRSELALLEKFVTDFADLSRDVTALERIPLELISFLESIRHVSALYGESLGITVEVNHGKEEVWALADRHLLERAVLNLVSNAIEASPRGAVVTLFATRREDFCTIEVVDRGSGIARERLEHLFDTFTSTKKTGAHIGMGLPNVKRIIDAHEGRVTVQSIEGKGTTFYLWIPAASPPTKR